MKKIFFCIMNFFCALLFLNAQIKSMPKLPDSQSRSWRILEKAELSFEAGKFEDAFYLIQKSKENRKTEVDWAVFVLEEALKPVSVQIVGDSLTEVIVTFQERNATNALNLINQILVTKSKKFFNDSVKELLSYIKRFYAYPELDYLSGKLYFVEGEFSMARQSFLKAWEHSEVLNVPENKYDILYDLASLAKIQEDYDEYEKTLLLIIEQENDEVKNQMMIRSFNISKSTNQFFALFRNNNYFSLKAYFGLADLYMKNNLKEKALEMSLNGVITTFSRIEEILKERNNEYKYSSVKNIFLSLAEYSDIIDWTNDLEIWHGIYNFAEISKQNGKSNFAQDIWLALYLYCPNSYWQKIAFSKLQ
ncbi:MAG: hypothetical protein GX220_07970 [Treponema sp.]|nr:hypothetical protein [Treponema sp.]